MDNTDTPDETAPSWMDCTQKYYHYEPVEEYVAPPVEANPVPSTVEELDAVIDKMESELLPKLRADRLSGEEEITSELDKLAVENAEIVAKIAVSTDRIRELFAEFTALKCEYAEYCKQKIVDSPEWVNRTGDPEPEAPVQGWSSGNRWEKSERTTGYGYDASSYKKEWNSNGYREEKYAEAPRVYTSVARSDRKDWKEPESDEFKPAWSAPTPPADKWGSSGGSSGYKDKWASSSDWKSQGTRNASSSWYDKGEKQSSWPAQSDKWGGQQAESKGWTEKEDKWSRGGQSEQKPWHGKEEYSGQKSWDKSADKGYGGGWDKSDQKSWSGSHETAAQSNKWNPTEEVQPAAATAPNYSEWPSQTESSRWPAAPPPSGVGHAEPARQETAPALPSHLAARFAPKVAPTPPTAKYFENNHGWGGSGVFK